MTPMPTDVTEIGKELYDGLAPLAEEDEANDWDLLRFADALIGQAQPVRDQARDRSDTELGWSIMMDVNNCPAYGLDWLSQFAGVDLTKLRRGVNVLARNESFNPSFEYDAAGSKVPFGYKLNNSASLTEEVYEVDEVWAAKGKKSLHLKAKKDKTATRRRVGFNVIKSYWVPISHGEWLTLQAIINIIQEAGEGFEWTLTWYKADASTIVTSSFGGAKFAKEVGIHTLVQQFEAPEHAAFAEVNVGGFSSTSEQVIEYRIDEIIFSVSKAAPSMPIEYVDGDQPGCAWVSTPGQSASIKATEQTEEQFNESKRFRIKELPASRRGGPAAIVRAAQQYLIGDKTVVMQERPGGNPWRLVVVTYTAETPNENLVREAIEEQLPAGIVLEYSVVPGADWLLVRTEYTTWQQVKEAFATWGGVRLNKPGT